MAVYNFADINIMVNNKYSYFSELCKEYLVQCDKPDLVVNIPDKDIEEEMRINPITTHKGYIESVCAYRSIVKGVAGFDAFMLHGAVFTVGERCLAFLAHSGTGKTTHLKLWMKLLGDRLTVINGDKPIIRFFGGSPYAYGTPFNGKENLGTKSRAILTDLCFIERSETNSAKESTPLYALDLIMDQIVLPNNSGDVYKVLGLIDELMNHCKIWLIKCNMDISAAETAYETIIVEGANINET